MRACVQHVWLRGVHCRDRISIALLVESIATPVEDVLSHTEQVSRFGGVCFFPHWQWVEDMFAAFRIRLSGSLQKAEKPLHEIA